MQGMHMTGQNKNPSRMTEAMPKKFMCPLHGGTRQLWGSSKIMYPMSTIPGSGGSGGSTRTQCAEGVVEKYGLGKDPHTGICCNRRDKERSLSLLNKNVKIVSM